MKTVNSMPKQVHLSNYAHLNIKNINKIRDDTEKGILGKANVLWTSSYNKYRETSTGEVSQWFTYCVYQISTSINGNKFIAHMKYAYLLDISTNVKVLEVGVEDETQFLKKYGKKTEYEKEYNINWGLLRKEYDGVHFKIKFDHFKFENFDSEPLYYLGSESSVFFKPVVVKINKMENYNLLHIVKKMYDDVYTRTHKIYAKQVSFAYSVIKHYYKSHEIKR